MAKKSKGILKMLDEMEQEVKNEVSEFYPNGELVEIPSEGKNDWLEEILSVKRKDQSDSSFTEEEIQQRCCQILENVKNHKEENILIDFKQKIHWLEGCRFKLEDVLVKARTFDDDEPLYLHLKEEDELNSLILIGGSDAQAFLVAQDESNNENYIRLYELHLLSFSKGSRLKEESGLLTSYVWRIAKVFSSVIIGATLDPIKNLFLAEYYESESEEAVEEKEEEEN